MRVKVRIKRSHIKNGRRGSHSTCPYALAIRDIGGTNIDADGKYLTFTYKREHIARVHTKKVCLFIRNFDDGVPVKPMTVILDGMP